MGQMGFFGKAANTCAGEASSQ